MAKTVYDVLTAAAKYDGSKTAHKDVIDCLNRHGHHAKMSDAWCTETIMAILYDAGCIDLVGGYSQVSDSLVKKAKKLGIWHKGTSGILPGDIVVYGHGDNPNHTELAVGATMCVSGNYREISKDTCARRKWTGRSVLGYVRPKYASMPEMDNLQITICACDVMLDVYSSGIARQRALSVFGAKNADLIQKEVTRVWGNNSKIAFDMAVYIIQNRAGKSPYREKRLGKYAEPAQKAVNDIWALRTHTADQAAQDVIANKYGKEAVRAALLCFNGYNPTDIQERVNKAYQEAPAASQGHFLIYPVWFTEEHESAYGDCCAIIEYRPDGTIRHCVLVDTAMGKTADLVVKKLKKQGVTIIDAIIISHGHGDHYGGVSTIIKNITTKSVYIPDTAGLDKYQKTYANNLRRQAAKVKDSHIMKVGDSYAIGGIKWKALYQAPAGKLKEHDSHHFVNNQSQYLRFDLGGIIYGTAGDMQNEANNLMISAGVNVRNHVSKFRWHGDANANNEAICKAEKPKIVYGNYHHKEGSGRGTTRKRFQAVGATVYRNYEDGDIFIDCQYPKITVRTSKSGKHDTFTVSKI